MARTIETFDTTSGQTWSKREDTVGRTYYVKSGEGRVPSEQFAAATSHRPDVSAFSRGEFEPSSVDELGYPYDQDMTIPVNSLERGSPERQRAAEVNRWLGFRYDDNTPDDPIEAAREYYKMRQELRDADTPGDERDVKRRYGIGGS